MTNKHIYLDHAATTPLDPAVFEAMRPWLTEKFGNPSAVYTDGRKAEAGIEAAREQIAAVLNADPGEIVFTSGGSEADNWVLVGTAFTKWAAGRHIITTAIEHPAVLNTCSYLEKCGADVTYLPVDLYGCVSPEDLEKAIRPDTILVSVMTANNEIGTIEPIAELCAIAHAHGIWFHTDAVQAFGNIPLDVKALDVDFLSMSAHKIYGPKGVGALYIKNGIAIEPFIHGGEQERGRRASTENTAGIAGFGKAAEMAQAALRSRSAHEKQLRDMLIAALTQLEGVHLTGHPKNRLPGNASFYFDNLRTEALLTALDLAGIEASGGSACTAGSLDPSHVLLAVGVPSDKARNALRLTVGKDTTEEAIQYAVDKITEIAARLA